MKVQIPELSLVVLIGASSSGKSTFAAKHFKATEVLSSDFFRALVADDENDLRATAPAFEALHFIAGRRLSGGRLTVVDATNVQPEARRPLVTIARDHHCLPVAIIFDLPVRLLKDRNRQRTDRQIPPAAIDRQADQLRRSLRNLNKEGFHAVYTLTTPEQIDAATIERQRVWSDRRNEHGPFDIIGDVHGCYDELIALLEQLGYTITEKGTNGTRSPAVIPPAGRRAVFLGDLVDRGPAIGPVLRLVMAMVEDGSALCVPGNHDAKLVRALRGRQVQVTHGLEQSLEQLSVEAPEFRDRAARFLDSLVTHYVLDDGRLVVAHAGMKAEMQGRASRQVRSFALYGETTGETDEVGLPVRVNWADEYRGSAAVVYGHTPVVNAAWHNNTINIDTGCVFGGRLTALRYPERELVSVPAGRVYYQPARPLQAVPTAPQAESAAVLDLTDVAGRRRVQTRLLGGITIRDEQARAALEVMSRFAIDPRWLIYLPPTMAPTETSTRPDLLEHPSDAFAYYARRAVTQLVCEEKHMGSRAIVIVCRDEQTAQRRFGATDGRIGSCYTRTGRPFFSDAAFEAGLLERVRSAAVTAGLWEDLETDWLCVDCELMPWSFKAEELLRDQYAAVGTTARVALSEAVAALDTAAARGLSVEPVERHFRDRLDTVAGYVESYRRYVWPVQTVDDLRLAPFHLLASAGRVHIDQDHQWHMQVADRLAQADKERGPGEILIPTAYRLLDPAVPDEADAAARWWEDLTEAGGEGIVVKPLSFVASGSRGILQPGLKSRGREYLRIIYGPEYTLSDNLQALRARGVARKRSLALREFALGIEALERFVRGDPLYRVHECVFGVLALESEPVDPRL